MRDAVLLSQYLNYVQIGVYDMALIIYYLAMLASFRRITDHHYHLQSLADKLAEDDFD